MVKIKNAAALPPGRYVLKLCTDGEYLAMPETEYMTNSKTGEKIAVTARDGKDVDEYDMMRTLRSTRKQKQVDKVPWFLNKLTELGYTFECLNAENYHYRIKRDNDAYVDYWPTTGMWSTMHRGRLFSARGFKSLIEHMERNA